MKKIKFKKFKDIKFTIIKKINFNFILYILALFLISITVYLSKPFFYDYNVTKTVLERKIHKNFGLNTTIKGIIKYSFFPRPKLIVQDIDLLKNKRTIGNVKKIEINIPFKEVSKLKSYNFDNTHIFNPQLNLEIDNLQSFLSHKFKKNTKIKNGKINFYEKGKFLFYLDLLEAEYIVDDHIDEVKLNILFLNEKINFLFRNNKKKTKPFKVIYTKIKNLNFSSNIKFYDDKNKKNAYFGQLILNLKNKKINSFFLYENSNLIFDKGKVSTNLIKGSFNGKLQISPYVIFNLDLNAKSLDLNTFTNVIKKIDKNKKHEYMKVLKKINGNLNFSAENIYSKSKLLNSLESELELFDGNIIFHRLLLDFGDLGASDLIGEINNRTKNSIFKFQKNVFIDDIKKFNKKFEIKNNTNENPTEISFSGKLNLGNFDFDLHQISKGKNIINKEESINAVNTFKKIMLTKNFESLINFENLKRFVKTIME